MGLSRAADRPRLPGGDARRVERSAAASGGLFAAERTFTAVAERGIAVSVRPGAGDGERTAHLRAGDVIDQQHPAALAAGDEVYLESKLVVVNHHRPRTG